MPRRERLAEQLAGEIEAAKDANDDVSAPGEMGQKLGPSGYLTILPKGVSMFAVRIGEVSTDNESEKFPFYPGS